MSWRLEADASDDERQAFHDHMATSLHRGKLGSDTIDTICRRVEVKGKGYYVKRYFMAGRNLRRYVGPTRAQREWRNLHWFRKHAIPTARPVAFGEGGRWLNRFEANAYWAYIVCEELEGTRDLLSILRHHREWLENSEWRRGVIHQLARVVQKIHEQGFIHNDLNWRNILVDFGAVPNVYIIDAPSGRKIWFGVHRFWIPRGMIRDLAYLDRLAKVSISRAERLRFYKQYRGIDRLSSGHKREVLKIVNFLGPKTVG